MHDERIYHTVAAIVEEARSPADLLRLEPVAVGNLVASRLSKIATLRRIPFQHDMPELLIRQKDVPMPVVVQIADRNSHAVNRGISERNLGHIGKVVEAFVVEQGIWRRGITLVVADMDIRPTVLICVMPNYR